MEHRTTDLNTAITVNRTIPLWGIILVVGGFAYSSFTTASKVDKLSEKVVELAQEQKALRERIETSRDSFIETKGLVEQLRTRVAQVENRLNALPAQMGSPPPTTGRKP